MGIDHKEIEEKWLKYWKKEKTYKEDVQIMRAIDLLKGIRVYQKQIKG